MPETLTLDTATAIRIRQITNRLIQTLHVLNNDYKRNELVDRMNAVIDQYVEEQEGF